MYKIFSGGLFLPVVCPGLGPPDPGLSCCVVAPAVQWAADLLLSSTPLSPPDSVNISLAGPVLSVLGFPHNIAVALVSTRFCSGFQLVLLLPAFGLGFPRSNVQDLCLPHPEGLVLGSGDGNLPSSGCSHSWSAGMASVRIPDRFRHCGTVVSGTEFLDFFSGPAAPPWLHGLGQGVPRRLLGLGLGIWAVVETGTSIFTNLTSRIAPT